MMHPMMEAMLGRWQGEGVDLAPSPEGDLRTPFVEETEFFLVGELRNAHRQQLQAIGYHQRIWRKDDQTPFHDQLGHWSWDATSAQLLHALVIPRGLALLAAGSIERLPDGWRARLSASQQAIAQSPFLARHAKTIAFSQEVELRGDRLRYRQTTELLIYDRTVMHTDEAELVRC